MTSISSPALSLKSPLEHPPMSRWPPGTKATLPVRPGKRWMSGGSESFYFADDIYIYIYVYIYIYGYSVDIHFGH